MVLIAPWSHNASACQLVGFRSTVFGEVGADLNSFVPSLICEVEPQTVCPVLRAGPDAFAPLWHSVYE